MKTNKITSALLVSTLALTVVGASALAATPEEIEKDLNKSNTMQVEIGTKDVIDPDPDPDEPNIDKPDPIYGQIGISQVSPLYFADVKLDGKLSTVPAQIYTRNDDNSSAPYKGVVKEDAFPSSKERVPSIQVLDARGTGEGWSVSVKASELKSGSDALKGSYLTYTKPSIKSTKDNTDKAIFPIGLNEKTSVTTGGDSVEILKADANKGMGTYYFRYSPSKFVIDGATTEAAPIKLHVPASAKKGNYTGTVTYTMKPNGEYPAAK